MLDRVLPVEDAEISEFAQKAFEKQGMTIREKSIETILVGKLERLQKRATKPKNKPEKNGYEASKESTMSVVQ